MPSVDRIRRVLTSYVPRVVEPEPFASVAMVLAGDEADPRLLFIERALREGDPWSGHMAFPGGRVEEVDRDLRETAERETREEVGLDLLQGELLGRLDDQEGGRADRGRVAIASFVYWLEDIRELQPNEEVHEAFWVPFSAVFEPERRTVYPFREHGEFPGIRVGHPQRHVVWGLTHRMLATFADLLGEPLP